MNESDMQRKNTNDKAWDFSLKCLYDTNIIPKILIEFATNIVQTIINFSF